MVYKSYLIYCYNVLMAFFQNYIMAFQDFDNDIAIYYSKTLCSMYGFVCLL